MSILDVLRFMYDTDTTELRMFGGFGWIRLGLYECGKIQLRSMYESTTNQVRIKGNSWQFLTNRQIFSL